MRKKNLLLSLISSVVVTIAMVVVTVLTFVKPTQKNNNNNNPVVNPISDVSDDTDYASINEFERNGSKEFPFVIYSTESYNDLLSTYGAKERLVTKPVVESIEENGKIIYVTDEDGHRVFEPVLDNNNNQLKDVYYFEFAKDIDFNGVEYVTLFNNGESFIGHLDGKNFTLNNVTINVTTENLVSKYSFVSDSSRYSHIGLFGDLDGAEISNMKINNLKINVAEDVFNYISNAEYHFADGIIKEVTVGSIAGIAKNSTKIEKVELNSNIAASSYTSSDSKNNAVGGVFGVAENVCVKNFDAEVNIFANAGTNYLVGGVAGYGLSANVSAVKLNVSVQSKFSRNLNIAGLFGYAKTLDVSDSVVNFNVSDASSVEDKEAYASNLATKKVSKNVMKEGNLVTEDVDVVDCSNVSKIAGLVCSLRADDLNQKTTISNVAVNSNVDFVGVFAGAVLDVYSASKYDTSLVTISDVVVSSNVKALAIHGFARQLIAATINYSVENTSAAGYMNLKIIGNAKLNEYYDGATYDAVSLVASTSINYYSIDGGYKSFFVELSADVQGELRQLDKSRKLNLYGNFKLI